MPRKLEIRRCVNCKRDFESWVPNKTACSDYCRTIFDNKRANARWAGKEYAEPKKHIDSDAVAYSFFRKGRIHYPDGYKGYRG